MSRLRISAISFLNTAPLMWDFERGQRAREFAEHFQIDYTVPSACAQALREGRADIGIIPAFAYASIPGLVILPDVAIAARRPVRSILLISKFPKEEIRTVALDTSSRSSAALTQVLMKRWGNTNCSYLQSDPVQSAMLAQADAALIIGDKALQAMQQGYFVYDLAEEWIAQTGKPFVFAFWTVRLAALERAAEHKLELGRIFRESRDHGLTPESVETIAREWAPRLGLTHDEVRTYLTGNIHYELDADCRAGLEQFFAEATELGLLPERPSVRMLLGPGDFR
jgi:chorismate dehydratase